MDFAYVLINCDTGSEESIITQLKNMDSIKEVQGTLGVYDIVAKIESKKSKEAVIGDIRNLPHVKSTLTLMGTGGIDTGEKMAELIPDIIPEEKKPLEGPADMLEEDYDDDYDEDDYDEDYEEKIK